MGTAAVTVYPNGTTQCSSGCTTTSFSAANGSAASVLIAIIAMGSTAQTATSITCYDNNAASASGTVIYVGGQLGAGQVVTFTAPWRSGVVGYTVGSGVTCQLQAAATGTGVFVWVQ